MKARNINKATYKFHSRQLRLSGTPSRVGTGVWFSSDFLNRELIESLFDLRTSQDPMRYNRVAIHKAASCLGEG